jgi:trigger factor
MQVSVETAEGLERRMRVQVPAGKIEDEVATRLKSVGQSAKISGFRPGKIPAKVIRQRFGGQVRQEVLQELLQSSYSEAIAQEKLQPAGGPHIEPETLDEGQDLTYTAVFEVYPEFELKGLDKLKAEEPTTDVGDADVDAMIEKMRKQKSNWQEVSRKSAEGDQVTIDFEGKLKDEVFEGGSGTDVPVVLGEGSMLEDFEKNLYGLVADDAKDFKLKFPKDYHAAELAGQKVVFSVTVKQVAASELPEVDEEFVKAFGMESGKVADLRADIEQNMQREVANKSRTVLKKQVMDGMLDANPIAIPGVLIDQEIEALRKDAMQRFGIQDEKDAPPADSFRETAESRVRLGLLMAELIKSQEMSVDAERVKAKVVEMCAPYDNPEQMQQLYLENPQLLSQIENMVIEEQLLDWLLDKSTVSKKAVGFEELMEL